MWKNITIGALILIIVVIVIIMSKSKIGCSRYENDLSLVAQNYNALASGVPSELKDKDLNSLQLNSNGFLSARGSPNAL